MRERGHFFEHMDWNWRQLHVLTTRCGRAVSKPPAAADVAERRVLQTTPSDNFPMTQGSLITYPYPARFFLLSSSLDLIFLTAAAAIFSPSLDWFGFDVAGRDFRFYLPLLGLVGEDDCGIDVKICRRRIWTEKDLHKIIFNSIFFMFLYDIGIWIL
ncbi:uncharacterized protein LOC122055253 [Zingiber officinale]|uniref:uncharacterized protein LOC122055253 n=1 Tax=Zingiber officinale TaxID=94328 RepID=UPI001C4D61C6|nr:uncharacterized protein LOC122055253 [Zingiber officinale]